MTEADQIRYEGDWDETTPETVRAWYEEFRDKTGAEWKWACGDGYFDRYGFPGLEAGKAFCEFIAAKVNGSKWELPPDDDEEEEE